MRYGKSDLGAKRPRYHPGLAWERNNFTNEFVDINRLALDDRYGHNGAPLSKRRRGMGFTDGKTHGLFGLNGVFNYKSKNSAFNTGIFTALSAYALTDFYLNRGHDLEGLKRRLARWPMGVILLSMSYLLLQPSD
jgi:hypothetical protein